MSVLTEVPVETRTILIVDDTPANLAVIVDHLEESGLQVFVAQGGEEALKRASYACPDLILLDVMMPGLDGFETCRRLKACDRTRDIPVIFMTALTATEDKVKAFASGGVDYVSKPFQVEELLARVRTHLDLRSSQQQLMIQNHVLQDEVVARTNAEAAVRSSELRYRRLFETANDGIALLDPQTGVIRDVNPALTDMIALARSALLGRRLDQIAAFQRIPPYAQILGEIELGGQVRFDDWVLESARGTLVNVEFNGCRYDAEDAGSIIQCNFRDITDRKEAEARIRYMALHDQLTGLANRTLLEDRLSQAVAQARRNDRQTAVMLLDLDRFKNINDSLGHHVGDQLLEAVAIRLTNCLRDSDTAARLGGDEFAICLPEVSARGDVEEVARKILAALQSEFQIENHTLYIGGSLGIALFPDDGADHGTLLRAADTAMYDSKAQGRGTFRFFTPELNDAAHLRHVLANDVRHACKRGEFELHYQPQLSLTSDQITGMETLLRWHHPTHGLVSPLLFIPLLEELGLMGEVGEWVLTTACQQAAQWQSEGFEPVRIAVNLSAQQFYRSDIVATVRRALEAARLNPQWLELELTESQTLDDCEATVRIMTELKDLGVGLSLDDFGTGWSSLSYLRRFPLDRIKIDRSFMRDVTTHENAAAVVHSILNLAQSLGLGCIAEGVETTEQLVYLKHEYCSEIQGFLFSRPLPASQMTELLESRRAAGDLELIATGRHPV